MGKTVLIRIAVSLGFCATLAAQQPRSSPPEGVLISTCQGLLPEDSGRNFGGQMFISHQGRLFVADSPLQDFREMEIPRAPHAGTPVKYRGKALYTCDPEKTTIYRWDSASRRWFVHARPSMGFNEYEVLFDDSILLIATFDREKGTLGSLLFHFRADDARGKEWAPFPKGTRFPATLQEMLDMGHWMSFPFEEHLLLYAPVSGRLLLVDGLRASVRELACDWLIDKDPKRPEVPTVPTCIQFFPTSENSFAALYRYPEGQDRKSIGRMDVELTTGTVKTRREAARQLPVWINAVAEVVDLKTLLPSALKPASAGKAVPPPRPGQQHRLDERAH